MDYHTPRVHVPNNSVFGTLIPIFVLQVRGNYMIIGYWDPEGQGFTPPFPPLPGRKSVHPIP